MVESIASSTLRFNVDLPANIFGPGRRRGIGWGHGQRLRRRTAGA